MRPFATQGSAGPPLCRGAGPIGFATATRCASAAAAQAWRWRPLARTGRRFAGRSARGAPAAQSVARLKPALHQSCTRVTAVHPSTRRSGVRPRRNRYAQGRGRGAVTGAGPGRPRDWRGWTVSQRALPRAWRTMRCRRSAWGRAGCARSRRSRARRRLPARPPGVRAGCRSRLPPCAGARATDAPADMPGLTVAGSLRRAAPGPPWASGAMRSMMNAGPAARATYSAVPAPDRASTRP